ncbi:replication initiation protein, partial [Spirosoma agri]
MASESVEVDAFPFQSIYTKHPKNFQSNLFTESRQEFTELEKKIVTLVINQVGYISYKGQIEPKQNLKVQVPFIELSKNHYDQVEAAARKMSKKQICYRNEKSKNFTFLTPFPLIRTAHNISGVKVLEVTILTEVVPYLAELGQRYTQYDVDVMLSLTSTYAMRMYEIVSMFHNRGQHTFKYNVEELRNLLNCKPTYRWNDFKTNLLDVAQRELLHKADINLEWVPSRKVGKTITELEFSVKTAHQLAAEAVKQDQQQINKMSINEAVTTAWQLMKGYKLKPWQKDLIISDYSLLETFYRVDSELANGLRTNIKNPTAYLVK